MQEQVARKSACESSSDMCCNGVDVSVRAFVLFNEVTEKKCLSVKLADKSDVFVGNTFMCQSLASNNRRFHRGINTRASEKTMSKGTTVPLTVGFACTNVFSSAIVEKIGFARNPSCRNGFCF